ncbi:glutamate-5-semialdehyde dehydrogenase [candidate division KSB3 bacterium]|uniref:Gamma-glutamyl phosphate reductase n=1 Tax=candidate division KSB3 bacterium TaxID=2044937 RepID=A0A2G6E902_9BACT|nr:MAG: glutamate-5-semialdehyde dehydrogenase [candidate division KSB3 bacterium]
MRDLVQMGQAAKAAGRKLAALTSERKNAALLAISDELTAQSAGILEENAKDLEQGRARGLSEALLDRLLLTEERLASLAADIRSVAALPDPVGTELENRVLPNGIRLSKRRIPIGVIGVIYEARPNVTIDIASLCVKTGNAIILRGGSETLQSNIALVNVIQAALEQQNLPKTAVQYLDNPDRALVTELLRLDTAIDMIVPRGGAGLHALCKKQSTIPVISGGMGICHIYVDQSADLTRAVDIVENAKVQRPSVCNALDTLLVNHAAAQEFLPKVAERLARSKVELRADQRAFEILQQSGCGTMTVHAGPKDFEQEWLSLILGIKIVDSLEEAIDHIQEHSMEHSDCILTNDIAHATRFVNEVTSSAVFVNASTRFNDGGQFGLGAEVAISTQKLHARGPMGLEALTTYKWIGIGHGHIRL